MATSKVPMPSHTQSHTLNTNTALPVPARGFRPTISFKMSSSKVAALKEQGNELYLQKRYAEAVRIYTQALELDPTNHVLYSNRCASSLREEGDLAATTAALRDAIKCIELQPEWAKGFFRLGAAREKLGQLPEVWTDVC